MLHTAYAFIHQRGKRGGIVSMDPRWQTLLIGMGIITGGVLLSWTARFLLERVIRRLTKRTGTILDDVIIRAAATPLRLAILVLSAEIAINQFSFLPADWVEPLARIFFGINALLLFIFLYRLIGGTIDWYGREVVHRTETDLDDKFLELFRRIILTILTIVVIVMVLGRYGIEVSGLVTTLGIGSLAVALAAQETLGDMFTGFTIMVDQPFQVGDRVELLDIGTWGDVKEIGLRSTRILTRDNRMVTVPNSIIGKGLIVNYSIPSNKYRVQTEVGIAYGSDIEKARAVMIEAIRAQDWVMKNERIEALFLAFGPSSLDFTVRCWIEHYVETRRIIDKMNTCLYHALAEAGIEIPFPQRDLHIVSTPQNWSDHVG
jgi:MscS family membrane protein